MSFVIFKICVIYRVKYFFWFRKRPEYSFVKQGVVIAINREQPGLLGQFIIFPRITKMGDFNVRIFFLKYPVFLGKQVLKVLESPPNQAQEVDLSVSAGLSD